VAVPFVCFPWWILLVFFGFLFQVIWPFLLACVPALLLVRKFSSLLVVQFANPPPSTSSSALPRRSFLVFSGAPLVGNHKQLSFWRRPAGRDLWFVVFLLEGRKEEDSVVVGKGVKL
jgi:hypothetical protein